MGINWSRTGANHTPAYQTSGVPYVTGSLDAGENLNSSTKKFSFPYVTRDITFFITNNDATEYLKVGFSSDGISGNPTTGEINYFRVNHNVSGVPIPVRCKEIYVASSDDAMIWSMVAGLTTIRNDQFPTLTGSIDGSTAFEGIG